MRIATWVSFVVGVFLCAAAAARAEEPDCFAAIGYYTGTGEYWFSYGVDTKEKAAEEVKKRSKDPSKLTIVTFKNCFCALAATQNGKAFGVGSGDAPLIAQEAALKECRKKSSRKGIIVLTMHTAQGIGGDAYFAIAFSKSTGRYGVAIAKASKSEAEAECVSRCDAPDAKVVAASKNRCIALALGKNKSVYGVGEAETEKEAKEKALEDCRKKTTDCMVVVSLNSKK